MKKAIVTLFAVFYCFSLLAEIERESIRKQELRLDRKAGNIDGFFQGLRKDKMQTTFKLKDCKFVYEKGSDEHPQSEKEYRYDRFIVSFLGTNPEGESAFDSVTYTYSEYSDRYQDLKFQKSFGPVSLSDVTKAAAIGTPSMEFIKEGDKAQIIFTHTDVFDKTKNSSFYAPGEKRSVKTHFYFSKFDEKSIVLEKLSVTANRKKDQSKAMSVSCSDFSDL